MTGRGRESELRDELACLDAEMADGERNANDIAEKAQRRTEIETELAELGVEAQQGRQPATYHKPE